MYYIGIIVDNSLNKSYTYKLDAESWDEAVKMVAQYYFTKDYWGLKSNLPQSVGDIFNWFIDRKIRFDVMALAEIKYINNL